jgi:hypothetical protein
MENAYNVKSVKFFRGMEGQGYNAKLYRGKKKVAFVYDDATGGCIGIEWDNKEDEVLFDSYLKAFPPYICEFDGKPTSHNEDTFMGELIAFEIERIVKRMMKKATFYNPPTNEFRSFKGI